MSLAIYLKSYVMTLKTSALSHYNVKNPNQESLA